MNLSFLPHLNAALNGLACAMLIVGRAQIKRRHVVNHRRCMIAAAATSGLFLVCYVVHYVWRARVVGGTHTPFQAQGVIKGFYYTVLLSHITLAILVPGIAIGLICLAATGRYETHKRVARIGLPIWIYVSVTGVLIYLMLYWFNPTL